MGSREEFEYKNSNGVGYFVSGKLKKYREIKHFFSTRIGGVSKPPYDSLNLGIYTKDDRDSVDTNFKRIFNTFGMNYDGLTYLKQSHGNRIYRVNQENYKSIIESDGDALVTDTPGIAIGVFTADCVPILVYDRERNVIAAVHAGWKGTVKGILKDTIRYMTGEMGCSIENIICAIGPSIGPCCFEIKDNVANELRYVNKRDDKLFGDLWEENRMQLIEIGVKEENISLSKICTMCNKDKLYSFRRDQDPCGRMGAFIQLI